MMNIKPWPVVAGVLVDIAGSIGLGFLYFVWMFAMQLVRGAPIDDTLGTGDLVVLDILGLLLTAVGGFVAARMAKAFELRHGVAVGVVSLSVWLLVEAVVPSNEIPWWYDTISFFALVPAAAFGGYVAAARRRGSEVTPQ